MFSFLTTYSPVLYFVQSVWRDEAFSILTAQQPIAFFFGKLTFEPPVYYILLHVWIKIFGTSEIAVRSLSLLGFALAGIIIIFWSEKLFSKHWLSWFTPVFFFLNPMLLYYAFEARAYGWYIFFATLTMYAYRQKNWVLYTASVTLTFYTHTFGLFIPAVTVLHYLIQNHKTLRKTKRISNLIKNPMIFAHLIFGLLITPWMFLILKQLTRLRQSWFFPVDFRLVKSSLGNLFIGYEGTPWYGWNYTAILSLIILWFTYKAIRTKKDRQAHGYFFLMTFVPLITTLAISFVKPIYVNRYLLPVTISLIFLIVLGIKNITNSSYQKISAAVFMAFIIGINIWYPSKHPKVDVRSAITEASELASNHDVIYAQEPTVLFETLYYAQEKDNVYLYNPQNNPFPWYVGDFLFSEKLNKQTLPTYPRRAFVIHTDGTYSIQYNIPSSNTPSSALERTR